MSTLASPAVLAQELAAICGTNHVEENSPALAKFSIDEVIPALAVSPGSNDEVAAILAAASHKNASVVPAGGSTAQEMGGVPERIDVLLRSDRLNQVLHYDCGDLTVGVGAGCTLESLQAVLAERGQFLPVDAARSENASVGGLLATAAHGPLRHGYGGLRDFCIGIQFVTGDGKLAKAGGRVVKNVTGYDLMKLMIGSQGTLGMIVSANFKVFPRPGQTRTFNMEFASLAEAIRFRDQVAQSALTPICLELISSRALEYLAAERIPARDPDDFHPTQPVNEKTSWRLLLRAAGSDALLARYRRELGSAITQEMESADEVALWHRVSNLVPAVAAQHRNAMFVDLSVVPAEVEFAIAAAEQAALDNNFILAVIGRAALGLLTVAFVPLSVDPPSAMQYATAVSALRGALPDDASATVARCPTEAKRHFCVWGTSVTDFSSMLAVKRALDPKGILNRGRYFVETEARGE